MPAVSQKQRAAMAIAQHAPNKLYDKNKSMLNMTQGQLQDYTATPAKGLPVTANKKKGFKL